MHICIMYNKVNSRGVQRILLIFKKFKKLEACAAAVLRADDVLSMTHACNRQTDRQTDRQTEGWTDRLSSGKCRALLHCAVKNQRQKLQQRRCSSIKVRSPANSIYRHALCFNDVDPYPITMAYEFH